VVPTIARWLQQNIFFLSGDYLQCHPNYDDGVKQVGGAVRADDQE
jgi:hypothetical protein